MLFIFMCLPFTTTKADDFTLWTAQSNISQTKTWNIKFNQKVDVSSIKNISVVDSKGISVAISTSIGSDDKTVLVAPPKEGYTQGQTYDLLVNGVTSNGKAVKPVKMPFTIINKALLKIHYIDVGQGDAILIQTPGGKNIMIDTGTNASTNTVTSYLQKLGITKLDILVGTHPHEDHIGGMDAIINMFQVGKVYMPKASFNTQTFKDVLMAIKNKGLSITAPIPGTTVDVDPSIKLEILAPNSSSYDYLNDYSIVLKLTYGSKSFLFTGDAQSLSESEMISKGYDLSADVLKVGHHGSKTSTSDAFLKAVNPKYAVISVGKGNDYGLPSQITMTKLKNAGITVYRTDESGNIICTSDGSNINFSCSPSSYNGGNEGGSESGDNKPTPIPTPTPVPTPTPQPDPTPSQDMNRIVYYTPKGHSYHYNRNCPTLKRSKTVLSGKLSDVIRMGKSDPCNVCVR